MHTNELINESSPYLLQHAHNPVNWIPYSIKAFEKAQQLNLPILLSIGYSACHWCHVMEHESFENETIAEFMNNHFVCIKVDREEHPDVDHAYMEAVQQIHGTGGWPLNCFALPDGKPFWGGTYFRPDQWMQLLENVTNLYQNHHSELKAQAEDISTGVSNRNYLFQNELHSLASNTTILTTIQTLHNQIDNENGGTKGAPKFPMPEMLSLLLQNSISNKDEFSLELLELSLQKMGKGGIFDQIGGGFSRYSVDSHWKVPHFEKMLYDNAQLISLYSKAYLLTKKEFYKQIVELTLDFAFTELGSEEGMFFSALDADSDGEEGFFYTWASDDFYEATGHYAPLAAEYYGVGKEGFWEHNRNILLRTEDDEKFAQQHYLSAEELKALTSFCRLQLHQKRNQRNKPGIDDKIITAWNALMISALVDSFLILENEQLLNKAIIAADFIQKHLTTHQGGLLRTYKNKKSKINAFLDDYAFVIKAYLDLYTVTTIEKYLLLAEKLIDYTFDNFYDSHSGFFWYSEENKSLLFARKIEIYDGVISSSNAKMAEVLIQLGKLLDKNQYSETAQNMLQNMTHHILTNPSAYSTWARIALMKSQKEFIVAVCGPNSEKIIKDLLTQNLSVTLTLCGSKIASTLPHLNQRYIEGKTMIYVCTENFCRNAVENISQAIEYLN